MAQRWCEDCKDMVDVTKKNYYAAIALAVSAIFFAVVPFFGTTIGAPAVIITSIWLYFTKNVCSRCGGKKLIKREPPTEAELVMRRYEENSKDQS